MQRWASITSPWALRYFPYHEHYRTSRRQHRPSLPARSLLCFLWGLGNGLVGCVSAEEGL